MDGRGQRQGRFMYHVVFLFLVLALTFAGWGLVMSAPRVLAMILPRKLTIAIGITLLVLGSVGAFASAEIGEPENIIYSILQVYMGLWWILATSAGVRGSYQDEQMLRRLF